MTIIAAAEQKKRALPWFAFGRQRPNEVILLRMPCLNPPGIILYSDQNFSYKEKYENKLWNICNDLRRNPSTRYDRLRKSNRFALHQYWRWSEPFNHTCNSHSHSGRSRDHHHKYDECFLHSTVLSYDHNDYCQRQNNHHEC